jgi:hypothetical protein
MMAPDNPRRRVTVLGFMLAIVLLPIGAVLGTIRSWDTALRNRTGSALAGFVTRTVPAAECHDSRAIRNADDTRCTPMLRA